MNAKWPPLFCPTLTSGVKLKKKKSSKIILLLIAIRQEIWSYLPPEYQVWGVQWWYFFGPPPIQKFQYFIDQSTCMFAHIWETDPSTFQLAKCRIFKIQTIPSGILNYISEGRLTKKSSVFITCIDGEKQKKANTFFTRKSSLVRQTYCCEYNSTGV